MWLYLLLTVLPNILFESKIGYGPLIILLICSIIFRKQEKWFHTVGATIGFIVSFLLVNFLRYMHNSLTSFYHFNSNENQIVLIFVSVGSVVGNVIAKRIYHN